MRDDGVARGYPSLRFLFRVGILRLLISRAHKPEKSNARGGGAEPPLFLASGVTERATRRSIRPLGKAFPERKCIRGDPAGAGLFALALGGNGAGCGWLS